MKLGRFAVFIAALVQGVITLEITGFEVPSYVIRNRDVRLECYFNLGDQILYSVKWYKDGHEFYKYIPRDSPPTQSFSLPGITVDLHNSTKNSVVLSSIQLSSTGVYRCEVSGEAPYFETVGKRGYMTVVALPQDGPRITGGKPRYQVGDTVNVNCTSSKSKPAAQLNWLINGDPADAKHLKGPEIFLDNPEELETTVLGLEFVVKPRHFKRGNMKLKCLATIATVYLVSNEESMEGERSQKGFVLESRGTITPPTSVADRVHSGAVRISTSRLAVILSMCWLSLNRVH